MMIIYFHETHFGKNSREPEAQPPWIQFWTGENLLKRLHREQNHPTGLVKTELLRNAKDKLLKRNRELKMGINIMRKYPYSSSRNLILKTNMNPKWSPILVDQALAHPKWI
ncbi:hypothetical protein PIB30_010540 [Stylosanthes scabra]|uniref:Uncharacterized protein n=1 Tax=Stylosanthes scabra TaxID=79078 RepID=A0ABU6R5F0_9FABA|nr:hypothetical protein [Stylosanthes scabra]